MKALIAQIASQYVQAGGKGGLTPLFSEAKSLSLHEHPTHPFADREQTQCRQQLRRR